MKPVLPFVPRPPKPPAIEKARTPRGLSFTLSINVDKLMRAIDRRKAGPAPVIPIPPLPDDEETR